jgi:tRNA pseudouridine55 synthase
MKDGRARVQWRPVDGVLLLDKAAGVTSNAALQGVRRLYRAAKAGHTGTLDPLATGLLPVLFGEATKFGRELLDADKTYAAEIALGASTTTGDAEGDVVERRPVTSTRADIDRVLAGFRGEGAQVPPMYSALKRDGRPLYDYARAGKSVERAARPITIHELTLDAAAGDRLAVTVRCSKGTYIRVLAEDIGRSLGCGAHLARLRRLAIGPFSVAEAATAEGLAALDPVARCCRSTSWSDTCRRSRSARRRPGGSRRAPRPSAPASRLGGSGCTARATHSSASARSTWKGDCSRDACCAPTTRARARPPSQPRKPCEDR